MSDELMKNQIIHFLNLYGVDFYKKHNVEDLVEKELGLGKLDQHILRVAIEEGVFQKVLDSVTKDDVDRQRYLNREIDKLYNEYGIDRNFLKPILQNFQAAYIDKILITKGKSICNQLKEMRRNFAAVNGIDYEEKNCDAIKPCDGTCPYCDMKTRELIRKAQIVGTTRPILFPETEVELIEGNGIKDEPIAEGEIDLPTMGEIMPSEEWNDEDVF